MRGWFRERALEARRVLREADTGIVITHLNADPDALGAALIVGEILRREGLDHCLALPEGLSRASKALARELGVELSVCNDSPPGEEGYVAVAVDSSNSVQLGKYSEAYFGAKARILVDHHKPGNLGGVSDVLVVDERAASSSEIAVVLSMSMGVDLPGSVASMALAGVIHDSKRFTFIGPYTFLAVNHLVESGADYGLVSEIFARLRASEEESLSRRMARLKAYSRSKVGRFCGDLIIVVTTIGSFESVVANSLIDSGADVAVVLTPRQGGYRASIRVSRRSFSAGVEASWIAGYLASKYGGEGGGHSYAAMAHVKAGPGEEELVESVLRSLVGKLGKGCSKTPGAGNDG